jgi:uncharacterized protein YgbK (DUF1537 family)
MEPIIKLGAWTEANHIGSDDHPDITLANEINEVKAGVIDTIVVLDDDPTGTQTVYDTPVLTNWEKETLKSEIVNDTPLFFVLTNSRSVVEREAEKIAATIGTLLREIERDTGKRIFVISRSDSTLRGHYPAECVALEAGLGRSGSVHFIIPAFFEGGRYTMNDIHYVKQGEELIPAARTSYAQDKVFGFKNSDLKRWVVEKSKGKSGPDDIYALSLKQIRKTHPDNLAGRIKEFKTGSVCVVNATCYRDLQKFTLALIQSGTEAMCRTAASFVKSISGLSPKPLLAREELAVASSAGGLIIAGSYVPKTTEQVQYLMSNSRIVSMELDVRELLTLTDIKEYVMLKSHAIDRAIKGGQDLVLFTTRDLIATDNPDENLSIGSKVSDCLTQIVASLEVRPKYIISKGGITSSDVATKGLSVRKATILGQILAGIPVWRLGPESKYPGLNYVVFPGNVGNTEALSEIAGILR